MISEKPAAAVGIVAAFVLAGGISSVNAQFKGVAQSDSSDMMAQRIATLELRVKRLEASQAALQQRLNKADVSDDGSEAGKKDKDPTGKSAPSKGQDSTSGNDQGGKASAASKDGEGTLKDVFPVMTLRAPFVVVDASGKPIFRVQDPRAKGAQGGDRGVYVYGDAGVANIALTTVYGGSKAVLQDNGGKRSVAVGAVDDGAGVKVRDGSKPRAYLGLNPQGNPIIGVYTGESDSMVAGIQTYDSTKGMVAVFNAGTPVAFLAQSGAHPGGGNVTTADPAGKGVFSAGYDGQGGTACVGQKNGPHCLGVGLPLGGQ